MKQKNYNIPTVVYFVVTALLIAYFFPREGKFRYQFYEGKPWRYGLLTAPSDFPIYKTDDEVKAEKDSVLRKFEPYYRMNPGIQKEEIEKLRTNYNNDNSLRSKVSPAYMQYIESSLINLYKNGIISSQDLDELRKEEYSRVNLLENAVAQPRYVSDFFTVRTAYEFIINNCPSRLDKSILQSCDINNYLTENISYAADMSDKIKEDMLQGVSIANGMVQAGERIVDRGEIIDNHTYNVLRSLKAIHEAKTGGTQTQGIILAGQFVLVFGLMFCFWLYLWSFRLKIFHNRKNVLFLILCIFVSCILTELCVTYALFNVYILPFAIVPIVVRTFFDSRTALFTHLANRGGYGSDVQLEGVERTFATDPLRRLHLPLLRRLLPQSHVVSRGELKQDQLDDDALFRYQLHPADVHLRIGIYVGEDVRIRVQHHAGGTVQHQQPDLEEA